MGRLRAEAERAACEGLRARGKVGKLPRLGAAEEGGGAEQLALPAGARAAAWNMMRGLTADGGPRRPAAHMLKGGKTELSVGARSAQSLMMEPAA